MKKLLAFLCLFLSGQAYAQSFPKPPDVPAYVAVEPTYASGTNLNQLGSITPPAYAKELADIATPDRLSWIYSGTYGESSGFKALIADGGTGTEMKFRTTLNATHVLFDDPIRNYGLPGSSHCHTFFGNPTVNAFSTYSTLRNHRDKSLAAGGPNNGTGYWFPCFTIPNAFGDGKNYAVMPDYVVVYYQEDTEHRGQLARIPLGLRYVSGFDMDNGWAWLQSKIDAANAQAGTSGRYQITNGSVRSVGTLYQCTDATGVTITDEKSNLDDLTNCPVGGQMIAEFSGARCWEGTNLWAPGGYKNVIPEVWDTHISEWVCPNGWYRIPALQIKVFFTHEGVAGTRGLNNWVLSCDAMGATLQVGYKAGQCFHTDWLGAWDGTVFKSWQRNCLGVDGFAPHECNDSVISGTQQLLTGSGAPTGRNPQVNLNQHLGTSSAGNMKLLPTTSNGPKTIHIHG